MKKTASSEIKRGQAITFRIPSDVSDYTLRQLQKLKETERRNFSSKIAEYVLDGIGQSTHQEREMIALPMPNKLSKSQRDWLKHSHSEAMLGTIMYHLLSDPLRATALLASLNSNVINEEIYLQDEPEENRILKWCRRKYLRKIWMTLIGVWMKPHNKWRNQNLKRKILMIFLVIFLIK